MTTNPKNETTIRNPLEHKGTERGDVEVTELDDKSLDHLAGGIEYKNKICGLGCRPAQ